MRQRAYGERTQVAPEATLAQIKRLVVGAGATAFATAEEESEAVIAFRLHGRLIRFRVRYPSPDDREFTHTEVQGWQREPAKARALWEQAIRQRWRALHLIIKAKIEAIRSGVVAEEEEFLPYTVMRSGQTVAEWVAETEQVRQLLGPSDVYPEIVALPPGEEPSR